MEKKDILIIVLLILLAIGFIAGIFLGEMFFF